MWRYANSALISGFVFVADRSLCWCVRSQVRFAFDLLCSLQPGMPVMALHGKCKHARRTQIYLDFVRRPGAVLLATDIAARGLDFPSVDWVIQVTRQYLLTFPMLLVTDSLQVFMEAMGGRRLLMGYLPE